MKRRDFIRTAAGFTSAAILRGSQFVTPASAPVPGIVEIGSTRQAFLDDLLIFEASRVDKFVARPQKYPKNPIIHADRDWERGRAPGEDDGVELFGQSVIYDQEEKIFKMWYLPVPWPNQLRPWCYAVSSDGYRWEKPDLGIYEYKGLKKNNILNAWNDSIGVCYLNVIKDDHDPDPQRRYKAMGELEGPPPANTNGGAAVAFSPDGIHWNEYEGNPVVHHGPNMGDSPAMLGWDPKIKKYVFYPRPGHPLAPEIYGNGDHRHIRSYGYSTSDDFIHWTPTRMMLTPDHDDRNDYQYMQYTAGIDGEFYIGFNAVYETHEQTWDIFLMSSRDGFHWNWIDRKVPFLGRSEYPGYDAGYMTPSGPIFHDNQVWIYYGAFSGAHSYNSSKLGVDRMTVALCTLPQNRWMGLMAGPHRATIITRPLIFKGSKLMVDIEAGLPMEKPRNPPRYDECEVRAALEDQSGGRIEGFTIDRSKVLRASGEQAMIWEGGDTGKLAGKPVRIRFEMHSAALYSIQFL